MPLTPATTAPFTMSSGLTSATTGAFTMSPLTPLPPGTPALIVAGITVRLLEGSAIEDIEQGGSSERAFAGNLISDCPWEKRTYKATTGLLTNAETATLKAAIAFRAHVAVSGLIPGVTVTCEVTWSAGAYISTTADDATGILRSLVLTCREV